jgi:hypothetical protein
MEGAAPVLPGNGCGYWLSLVACPNRDLMRLADRWRPAGWLGSAVTVVSHDLFAVIQHVEEIQLHGVAVR